MAKPEFKSNLLATNVLVIGAGVAGLAAAGSLAAAGRQVTVLEARNRIGGRVWTDNRWGYPLENGAEFIHGDKALTWRWVEDSATAAVPIVRFESYAFEVGGELVPYGQLQHQPDFARMFAVETQELPQVDLNLPDCTFGDWLGDLGIGEPARRVMGELLANSYLARPEQLGLLDLVHEAQVHHAGEGNFRLRQGYLPVLQKLAAGLDIHLGTAVRRINWHQQPLQITARVENQGGSQELEFTANWVLVTVPLALLQQQVIHFDPPLPANKQAAISALAMGPVVKLHLEFSQPFWDPDISLFSGLGPIPVWWAPGYQRPNFPAVLTAFVGADRALALDRQSEPEALETGLADLCRLFKSDQPRQLYHRGQRNSWNTDPWSRGGYSYAPPGAAWARRALATPLANQLFFAGEATVTDSNPATVHGAMASGLRAAAEILRLNA